MKIYVVGVGYKPLDEKARKILENSRFILAPTRVLEVFKRYDEFEKVRDKTTTVNDLGEMINLVRSNSDSQIVILSSGDPMFFGIGRRLVEEFGKDKVEIIPDLSSLQVAFSRIKESWDDALFLSLHGRRKRGGHSLEDIPELLERHHKIAILTDSENNPSAIARVILNTLPADQIASVRLYVCERLGYPDERITEGTPSEIAELAFSDPNVVLITRERSNGEAREKPSFGLREDEIAHIRGMITKDEIRAVVIHKLRLPKEGVLWDVGAGSGSVSIEAARICPRLKVFAVEKDGEQVGIIRRNLVKFRTFNVEVVEGEAPEVLEGLPRPDRVFIGGNSGKLREILEVSSLKMGYGIIVVNAVTLETLEEAISELSRRGFEVEVSGISVSRSEVIGGRRYLKALNPVFIVRGIRDGS